MVRMAKKECGAPRTKSTSAGNMRLHSAIHPYVWLMKFVAAQHDLDGGSIAAIKGPSSGYFYSAPRID